MTLVHKEDWDVFSGSVGILWVVSTRTEADSALRRTHSQTKTSFGVRELRLLSFLSNGGNIRNCLYN